MAAFTRLRLARRRHLSPGAKPLQRQCQLEQKLRWSLVDLTDGGRQSKTC